MITCIGYIHMLKIVSKTYIVIKGMLTSQANNYIVTKSLYTISISVVCVKKAVNMVTPYMILKCACWYIEKLT